MVTMMRVSDAAEILGVSVGTVRDWLFRGVLNGEATPRESGRSSLRVTIASVEAKAREIAGAGE
jgi:transposase